MKKKDYIKYDVEVIIIHEILVPVTNRPTKIASYHRYRGLTQSQLNDILNLNKNCPSNEAEIIINIRGAN